MSLQVLLCRAFGPGSISEAMEVQENAQSHKPRNEPKGRYIVHIIGSKARIREPIETQV